MAGLMKNYPNLAEMGVLHPDQIEKFSVNSISNYDILRIVYNRRIGSLLPLSRTYKFPRVQKSVTMDGETRQSVTVMETDPALRSAVSELQDLLEAKEQKKDVAKSILEELRLLEEDISLRAEYIRELAKHI